MVQIVSGNLLLEFCDVVVEHRPDIIKRISLRERFPNAAVANNPVEHRDPALVGTKQIAVGILSVDHFHHPELNIDQSGRSRIGDVELNTV